MGGFLPGDGLLSKGGKHHAVPVHHKAEAALDAYLDAAAGIAAEKESPLWRSMPRAGGLSPRRMSRKELLALEDGYRESAESWAELLRGLQCSSG